MQNIEQDPRDMKIVQSIISIGKLFELKIQAEGIETFAQHSKLKEFGCDFSQGFYHSHPIGFEEFLGYYKQTIKKASQ